MWTKSDSSCGGAVQGTGYVAYRTEPGTSGVPRLQDILIDAGLVNQRQPYEKIVRPEFTQEVVA